MKKMTETNTDELLKEFLQDDVPCEGDLSKGPHPADNYYKFQCEHCDATLIGAQCDACHLEILPYMERAGSLPCLSCPGRSSLDAYTLLGPVR
jgi:hypothetical protein